MKHGSAQWLLTVFIITGVLLADLGAPATGFSEALWSGKLIANVNLRKTPSLQGDIIAGLMRGSPVEIYEERGGWYRVSVKKYHQAFQGWVSLEYVTIVIEETPAPPPGIAASVKKSRSPEAKAAAVLPEPETDKPAAAAPPQTKIAAAKTERPPRVAKNGTEPGGDPTGLLPIALPVLVVVVLLIAVIAYRVRRPSGPKADIADSPADSPAVESPPPAAENSLESEEDEPAENELAEEDPAAYFESQMESLHAELPSGANGNSPVKAVSVYDLVMENIYRLSREELLELQHLIEDQLGGTSRKEERLSFYTTVDYSVEGQYYRDFLQDLSVSGVFIKTRQMFEPGQHIMMSFMAPFLQKPFKISGEIVRTLDTGIGVRFDQKSQVQAEAISALLEQIRMVEESI